MPSKSDKDFLGVVGSRVNPKKAGRQLESGYPTRVPKSKKGTAKYVARFAGANYGRSLALQKTAEFLGNESKIREAQANTAESKASLEKTLGSLRSQDSGRVARVVRRGLGLPGSRLESAARRGIVGGYKGTAGFIGAAAEAGSRDAVTIGNLRPEQFDETIAKQQATAMLAKKQALGPVRRRR